ncbi:MAG: hypothetical protein GXP04_12300 [Alphaproteobacteria bacterium]|nr:hypothetical protein [Alphaproteobacteria bacterium]
MSMNREYNHKSAVVGSGLDARAILQWRQRELFNDLGKLHATGRYVYSRREIIQLRVVAELVRVAKTPPSLAVELAGAIVTDLKDSQIAPGHTRRLIVWVYRPSDEGNSKNRHEFETYYADDFFAAAPKLTALGGHAAIFLPLSNLIHDVDDALTAEEKK